ncbi:MAG: hypothetical protein HYS13_12145 [Planctomycetia bacterium]|nr:hypothetical protein [Planctomycetia bacterium]
MRSPAMWWKGLRAALGQLAQGARGHLARWREKPERPLRRPWKRLHFEVLEERTLLTASIYIDDAVVIEGSAASFRVYLNADPREDPNAPVTVEYWTADGSAFAKDPQGNPLDYTEIPANPNTKVSIPAGQNSAFVSVQTHYDWITEGNENFYLRLGTATNGVVADPQGEATILPPDNTVTIADAAPVWESQTASFRVWRTNTTLPTSIRYQTVDGTAYQRLDDYTPTPQPPNPEPYGEMSFTGGALFIDIPIATEQDGENEKDETFFVKLTAAYGAVIGDPKKAMATIQDDDPEVTVVPPPKCLPLARASMGGGMDLLGWW